MAERERLPKRERRERAREERRRQEEEARRRARRQRLTGFGAGAVVLVVIAWVLANAFGGDTAAVAVEVSQAEVDAARSAAGCEVIDERTEFARDHYEPAQAPPADALYGEVRPTNGGPHFFQTAGLVTDGSSSQLDERAVTHNLEHGAIIAWYDPEQVDGDTVAAMERWSEDLNDSGFGNTRSGAGIFVSPYTEPGISSGKAIALRGWGLALDCGSWDEVAANGFVIDRYGTHGAAPERNLSPYHDGVLSYADRSVADNTEAPADGDTEAPADGDTEAPADGDTEAPAVGDTPSDMVGTTTPTVEPGDTGS